ncbi:hypothetical protein RKE29_11290 [Streptomyces sp. B1866]|uniref:hypothetical protein n=1 Tax=Streptomyces sp. B1866 TaxID=3075431 RepID=UPI00288CCB3F|nr:hypothetical protein [Streptomyces sp. B1866]MDT3397222.1 hypothetical protein [Streptomyces sp. B1866]
MTGIPGPPPVPRAAGGAWLSAQCVAAVRPGGVVEAHALCHGGRCACRCHRKVAVSLGLLVGGPTQTTGDDPTGQPEPVPVPPEAGRPGRVGDRRRHPPVTPAEAVAEMLEAGYEPIETYPGRASVAWSCRCTTCGAARRVKLSEARAGQRCHHVRGVPLLPPPPGP